jgi:hypothetical protein
MSDDFWQRELKCSSGRVRTGWIVAYFAGLVTGWAATLWMIGLVVLFLLPCWSALAQGIVPQTSWYWQLDGVVNTGQTAKVYDIDGEGASSALIGTLHSGGHTVICYLSAGTWENWRSDASDFPKSVIGNAVGGWPGEFYLNVRDQAVRDLMAKRMDGFKAKGCDGLEPDNVDLYSANTGFGITTADSVDYDQWLASAGHARGMLVALKNSSEVVKLVVSVFDFAVAEECFDYQECPAYSPFIAQNKAVLVAEYTKRVKATWCAKAASLRMSLAFFNLDLNGRRYLVCS